MSRGGSASGCHERLWGMGRELRKDWAEYRAGLLVFCDVRRGPACRGTGIRLLKGMVTLS